jgi:hypothetical protein
MGPAGGCGGFTLQKKTFWHGSIQQIPRRY